MSYAINKGVRIHYEIVENGPPLILQHGFTQSVKDWHRAGYVEALKPHYQMILVDARGHGESDKPHDAAAYTLSSRVNDIVAVMDSIGISRANYWGYSMGGWIGFGMAMEAQARLRAIIIGGQDPYGRKMPPGPDGSDAREFITLFATGISEVPRLILFCITSFFVAFVVSAQRKATENLRRSGNDLQEAMNSQKRIEAALLHSEMYLTAAQRLSRTGSFGWNVDSGDIFWSDETFRIFQY